MGVFVNVTIAVVTPLISGLLLNLRERERDPEPNENKNLMLLTRLPILLTVFLSMFLHGCTTLVARSDRIERNQGSKSSLFVDILYLSTRNRVVTDVASKKYGTERGQLEYGKAVVKIPKKHKQGEFESPKWWKLEFSKNPDKHVTLLSVTPLDRVQFMTKINPADGKENVLVFVHGFNVSFEDSLRRTAQLAYDLNYPGIPVAFTWPSQGSYVRIPAKLITCSGPW